MRTQTVDKITDNLGQFDIECLDRAPSPIHLLTNGQLVTMLTAGGTGYCRLRHQAVTRWKPDISADSLGYFFFLRDLESHEYWSLAYQPTCREPDAYCFTRTLGTASIERRDRDISARMEVCVHKDLDVELRRCTLTNHGKTTRTIEVTSYVEVALHDPVADLVHLSFSKIFVETRRADTGILLARRRPRRNDEKTLSACHFLVHNTDRVGRVEFETDRNKFIGRGYTLRAPAALLQDKSLSGATGSVLDPIFSLRTVVILPPESSVSVTFGLGAGYDLSTVTDAAEQLSETSACENAFAQADNIALAQLEKLGVAAVDVPSLLSFAAKQLYGFGGKEFLSTQNPSTSFRDNGATLSSKKFTECLESYHIKDATTHSVGPVEATRGSCPAPSNDGQSGEASQPGTAGVRESLHFENGLGGFSADGREYVIRLERSTDGKLGLPPVPWNNVICNESIGFIATETGAGNTWSRNSRLNRLTPWQNDPVLDPHSEAFYLRDDESGDFWSVAPGPMPKSCGYDVCHGWGYSSYRHTYDQLAHELTQFAPSEDAVKISRILITNQGNAPRRLSLYGYLEWELGEGLNLSRLATRTEINSEIGAIFATNASRGEFSHLVAFAALAGSNNNKCHLTGDRTEFLGLHGSTQEPAAVVSGRQLSGHAGNGYDPCAALGTDFVLEPGQSIQFAFLLGETESEADAERLIARYQTSDEVDRALAGVKAFWQNLNSAIEIETPSRAIDLMINGWLPYQNISCRLWGRTSAQQSGGAYGFRDQLQDSSALVFHRPDFTRQQILRNAAHQFVEGDVLHWWHPPLSKGIRTTFSDDLLWMPLITCEYVQATGEESLWDEPVRFITAEEVPPGEPEIYLTPSESGQSSTLYEHCCRALDRSLTRGANGLPLMGCGDWNDGMNRVGQGGTGESVWMGFFIDYILERMLPVCRKRGDQQRFDKFSAYREQLREALEEAGWDGNWYRRAYFDDGTPLGTSSAKECRIDALVQAWAVLSGAARPDRAARAIAAADEMLVDEKAGIIRLLDPPFNKMPNDPGYIKGYLPGIRENGGQYTHGVLWLIRAIAELGQGTRACQLLEMLSPVSHGNSPETVATYKAEPYVVAADVYGQPPHVGRAGWSWYTGSAGWMFRVAVESILGLHLENGTHLRINPSISRKWPECSIRYRPFEAANADRKTIYEISIRNSDGNERGVKSATCDGAAVAVDARGAHVPFLRDGLTHRVVVEL